MIRWILGTLATTAWMGVVFAGSLWFTFPSDAVVARLQAEVSKSTAGTWALEADSASPWWAGVSLSNVRMLSVDEGKATPMLEADGISVRTSASALLGMVVGGSALPVVAQIELRDSVVALETEVADLWTNPKPSRFTLDAPDLDVDAAGVLLTSLLDGMGGGSSGVALTGTGKVALSGKMDFGAGIKESKGRISLTGKGLDVTLAMPDLLSGGSSTFQLGPMKVSSLDFVIDVQDGVAKLQKATFRSDAATVVLAGDVTLNDRLAKSRIKATMEVSELGGQLATFEPFLAAAKWDDEKYHYRITCSFDRFQSSCIRPDRQRTGRNAGTRPSAGILDEPPSAAALPPNIGNSAAIPASAAIPSNATDAEAERLREERRRQREERLAERRRRIEEARENGDAPIRPDELDPPDFDPDLAIPDGVLNGPPDLDLRPGMSPGSAVGVPMPPDDFDE